MTGNLEVFIRTIEDLNRVEYYSVTGNGIAFRKYQKINPDYKTAKDLDLSHPLFHTNAMHKGDLGVFLNGVYKNDDYYGMINSANSLDLETNVMKAAFFYVLSCKINKNKPRSQKINVYEGLDLFVSGKDRMVLLSEQKYEVKEDVKIVMEISEFVIDEFQEYMADLTIQNSQISDQIFKDFYINAPFLGPKHNFYIGRVADILIGKTRKKRKELFNDPKLLEKKQKNERAYDQFLHDYCKRFKIDPKLIPFEEIKDISQYQRNEKFLSFFPLSKRVYDAIEYAETFNLKLGRFDLELERILCPDMCAYVMARRTNNPLEARINNVFMSVLNNSPLSPAVVQSIQSKLPIELKGFPKLKTMLEIISNIKELGENSYEIKKNFLEGIFSAQVL